MKNKFEIDKRMEAGEIIDASFATINSQGDITPYPQVEETPLFQCASLSKPVFAYLVLKLIETNKTQTAETGLGKFSQFDTEFNLKTPLYEVFRNEHGKTLADDENPFLKKFGSFDRQIGDAAKILFEFSHTYPALRADILKEFDFQEGSEITIKSYEACMKQKLDATKTLAAIENLLSKIDEKLKNSEFRDMEHPKIYPLEIYKSQNFIDREWAKRLTAEMVLSHRTGLHIAAPEPFSFQFEPGDFYAYSGPGIDCLQMAIEKITGVDNLQILAWENIFRKEALDMPNSSYGSNPVAANSLKTTSVEYAKFIKSWINDDALNYAFFQPIEPHYSMMNDYFPQSEDRFVEKIVVEDADRVCVTWGLGVGLVKNKEGQIIGAYHTGDMGDTTQWRAGVGATIDPETNRCIEASVYLAKSPNGHMLAELVLPQALYPALKYFFPTYGFAQNPKELCVLIDKQLYKTNFLGLNPSILIKNMQEAACKTKITISAELLKSEERPKESMDSTQKMFQQLHINPLSTNPEFSVKTIKTQEQKAYSNKPMQEVKEIPEDKVQEKQKFNPTPFPTLSGPYKK